MRVLVTGSSGHLGEALVRVLGAEGIDVVGLDVLASPHTSAVGSIADRAFVRRSMAGADAVIHAATLHKPHVGSHTRQDFVDTNIYGATKTAAEDLCELAHRDQGLPCLILRTSRFFPEEDDRDEIRNGYPDMNVKVNELLYRRGDIEDMVGAHRLALERVGEIGFGRYIVSATTPFTRDDLAELRADAPAVVRRLFPDYEAIYAERDWSMFPSIDRVYDNTRAREELGWAPRNDFRHALDRLAAGEDPRSELALTVGAKGYHAVGVHVPLAVDGAVVHRVVRVDLPPEQLGVVAPELLAVLPDHLEVHYRLSHGVSFRQISAPVARRSSILSKKPPQPSFARSYCSIRPSPLCSNHISVRPSPRSVSSTVMSA